LSGLLHSRTRRAWTGRGSHDARRASLSGPAEPRITASSDPRSVLDRILTLRGVTWEWRHGAPIRDRRGRAIGLLAQDVQAAFPEAVIAGRDGYLRVDYEGLVGALVEAVKELAECVEQLRDHGSLRAPVDHNAPPGNQ